MKKKSGSHSWFKLPKKPSKEDLARYEAQRIRNRLRRREWYKSDAAKAVVAAHNKAWVEKNREYVNASVVIKYHIKKFKSLGKDTSKLEADLAKLRKSHASKRARARA